MRRFSILFIVLGLISFSASSTHAQSREIGAQSLALDDNHGHVVDITIPLMTGPGPYSWVLPITPGGSALSLPFGTINNSTLFWSGTQWAENTHVLATNTGNLTVTGNYLTVGSIGYSGVLTLWDNTGLNTVAITPGVLGSNLNYNIPAAVDGSNFVMTNVTAGQSINKLGINQAPGADPLDVNGNASISGNYLTVGSVGNTGVLVLWDNAGLNKVSIIPTSFGSDRTFGIPQAVTGSNFIMSNVVAGQSINKLGINQAPGADPLDVNGNASISGNYLTVGSVGNTGVLVLWDNAGLNKVSIIPTSFGSDRAFGIPSAVTGSNFIMSNVAGGQTITGGLTSSGNVSTSGHIITTSTSSLSGYDGTIVTAATITGSDVAGTITISTAALAGNGVVDIQFGTTYGTPPIIVITPANAAAEQGGHILGYYVNPLVQDFLLYVHNDAIGVTNATYNYIVIH